MTVQETISAPYAVAREPDAGGSVTFGEGNRARRSHSECGGSSRPIAPVGVLRCTAVGWGRVGETTKLRFKAIPKTRVASEEEEPGMPVYDVVVVGGGNLGLWTAHRLAGRGFGRIAVLERGWAGGGATSRSAGIVRQQGGSETAARLGKLSRKLYLSLGEELGLDSGFRETGYFIVAETEEEKEGFLRLVDVRREAGVENEWVEPEEGRRRFPDLEWDRFVGATYTADDGYVHPPIAARNATLAVLSQEEVDLFEMCEVLSVEERGDHYGVETACGVFEAERVVDAGGPRG